MALIVFDPIDTLIEDIITGESINSLLSTIKGLSKENFQRLLDSLSDSYHNSTPIITDKEFDLIESIFESKYGKNTKVGAKPVAKSSKSDITIQDGSGDQGKSIPLGIRPSGAKPDTVSLPIPMWGLAKYKDAHDLDLYKKKYPTCDRFIITDKLDGNSVCLIQSKNGSKIQEKLYKRGDEKEGSDLSYLLPYISHPKPILENGETFSIRAEIVMPLETFNAKYSQEMANTRNMTSGLLNSKTFDIDRIKDLHLVAYHIYSGSPLPQSEQLDLLKKRGFLTAHHNIFSSTDINIDTLTAEMRLRKPRSPYDIDGLCIAADLPIPLPTTKEPEHVVAFKIQGDTAITTIIEMEWSENKFGRWIPVAITKPVFLDGGNLSRFTANNARWVEQYGLGTGAVVVVTRSGSTIPKILETIEKVDPEFPAKEWIWENSDDGDPVHIRIPYGAKNDNQEIKKIVSFFKERGVEFMAKTTVTKLYEGGLNTLQKLFEATVKDITEIDGFKTKSAERILKNISKAVNNAPIHEIMAASGCFPGFGKKRLKLIIDNETTVENPSIGLPPWCGECSDEEDRNIAREELRVKILGIPTLGPKLADAFVICNPEFDAWMNKHYKYISLTDWGKDAEKENDPHDDDEQSDEDESSSSEGLRGQILVFTGCRASTILQRSIEKSGGKVASAVSGKTTMLIVKSLEAKETAKIKEAREKGVDIIDFAGFLDKYGLKD